MQVKYFIPPLDQLVVSIHGFYKNQNPYHTCSSYYLLHVGVLWYPTPPPISLVHTQVVWLYILLCYVAQDTTRF